MLSVTGPLTSCWPYLAIEPTKSYLKLVVTSRMVREYFLMWGISFLKLSTNRASDSDEVVYCGRLFHSWEGGLSEIVLVESLVSLGWCIRWGTRGEGDPRQPGFDLPRQQWSLLNRFRMEQGHCGACRRKWWLTDTDLCPCGLVAGPRRCPTMSNPIPWQNWMVAYLGYTLRMKTLFHGWPIMVHDTHTRRRRSGMFSHWCMPSFTLCYSISCLTGKIFCGNHRLGRVPKAEFF